MAEREITIIRKKTLLNNSIRWNILIDDEVCDNICGGEIKKFNLDSSSHTLSIHFNDPNIGRVDKVQIPKGNMDFTFHISLSSALMGNTFKSYIKIKQL